MTDELKALLHARDILTKAYMATIGMEPAHTKVWHAVEHIDKQTTPIIADALKDDAAA